MTERSARCSRKTKETDISLSFTIEGQGPSTIQTGIPFFDHMLDLFSHHGLFEMNLAVKGDIQVDFHHTVEDVGICLGQVFREALGNASGIQRYASGLIPMDEALVQIAIDISGRPYLHFKSNFPKAKVGEFDVELVEEFFRAFATNARITMHMDVLHGVNLHHMIEGCFKGFGVLLDQASQIDPRKKNIPSTKGVL